MSLLETKAWALREQESASQARAILPAINGDASANLRRIYLFGFPIYNKVARMDRERQLFNVHMADHIAHEHRRNPWGFRSVIAFLVISVSVVLYQFPPPIVQESTIYQNMSAMKQRAVAKLAVVVESVRAQSHIPEKVLLAGEFSLPKLIQEFRGWFRVKVDPQLWQARMVRQMQEIQETTMPKSGLGLGPNDGVVLAVRGEARVNRLGLLLQPKDVVRQGGTIVTGPRSFVKIWLADGSTLSVGPDSEVKIPRLEGSGPPVLELLSGTLRAKVTKSAVPGPDGKPPEKLIIVTRSAALGIRGTDFYVSYTGSNEGTTLVTFEGLVAFAKRADSGEGGITALEGKSVVPVGAGTFSEVRADQTVPAASAALSPSHLEQLKGSTDISGAAEAESQAQTLRYLDELSRTDGLFRHENSNSGQYEALSDDELEEIAAPVARQHHYAPRKEDYELSTPPVVPAKEKREYPDL